MFGVRFGPKKNIHSRREIDKIFFSAQSIQSIKFDELCARISMHFYRFRRSFFFSWLKRKEFDS